MAKWGEGDPRWIVEERPDATNVNNWHWSEKNASSWSIEKLKSLIEGQILQKVGLGSVTLTSISKFDGEATANNRKGKLIVFYEWALTIDWAAKLDGAADGDQEIKGTLEIPNLSEENDASEVDVNVTVNGGGEEGDKVKNFLRKEGTLIIQEKLGEYVKALTNEYAKDLILPTSNSGRKQEQSRTLISPSVQRPVSDQAVSSTLTPLRSMALNSGCQLDVKDLSLQFTFKCRVQDLYNAFTIPEMVTAFTRERVKMDVTKGGKFELFGGNIVGSFQLLEPHQRLVQKWRFKTWPEGHYSTVTLTFEEKEDCTELALKQTQIPSNDFDRTRMGWKNYYFESIKRTFGFGATLV